MCGKRGWYWILFNLDKWFFNLIRDLNWIELIFGQIGLEYLIKIFLFIKYRRYLTCFASLPCVEACVAFICYFSFFNFSGISSNGIAFFVHFILIIICLINSSSILIARQFNFLISLFLHLIILWKCWCWKSKWFNLLIHDYLREIGPCNISIRDILGNYSCFLLLFLLRKFFSHSL